MNSQTIESIHYKLGSVHDEIKTLLYLLWEHNPGVGKDEKEKVPVPAIAQSLGGIVSELNTLRIDLVNIREAEQLEEA